MNRTIHKISLITFIVITVAGCATTPPPVLEKPIQREKTFSSSYNEVWSVLLRNLANAQAIIHVANKESGVVQYTQPLPAGAGLKPYLIQQSGIWGQNYREAKGHMTVTVKKEGEDQTSVRLNSRIEGALFGVWGERLYSDNALPSSGRLEGEFFNGLTVELGEKQYQWLETEPKAQPTETMSPSK